MSGAAGTGPAPGRAGAIILAAGRGERMRPLTDACPKPLLAVRGKPLIVWHIEAFARAGIRDIVINTAWLEQQFPAALGDGAALGVRLHYSTEGRDFGGALETAGGIARALPALDERFWVVAGDVWCPGFDPAGALGQAAGQALDAGALACIGLVDNPAHNPRGDFALAPPDGSTAQAWCRALNTAAADGPARLTYATFGLYRRGLFQAPWCDIDPGNPQGIRAPLAPLLRRAMDNGLIGAVHHTGPWTDVGTPERLAELNRAG